MAVVDGDRRLTYREIDARANQLAHHLRRLGVGRETLVGLCLERSADLVVAILGVLKAGAAYVPLDPCHATQRLAFYLADARASVLVSTRSIGQSWSEELPVVYLDEHAAALRTEPESPPELLGSSDDLAYVIYTSGSTGTPKGVMVTHRNVIRLFLSTRHLFGFDERDVWTLFHSYAFDFSVWEIWGALLHGGRLVVVPADDCRALHRFARLLKREGVTVLCQTPSAFRQLAPLVVASPDECALRYVVFGGEALDLTALRPWVERFGDERPRLVNMYGITETTVHVTYRPIRRADLEGDPRSVIGVPIPDMEVLLLAPNLEPVPTGETGEVFVSGEGLARGYLHRPELTAERFIRWPRDGRRLYRSGDLARRLPDGDLEYLGRIDDQVKIRGFRIELGEVTAQLLSHPGVTDAAVVVQGDASDKRLVAYVVPRPGQALAAHDLQHALSQQLPEYMLPSFIVFLDRLPLTINGKLDRAALPAPLARTAALRAPETRVECVLARLFSDALGVAEVGLDDNFFALGGHSLNATQILWAIERELGVSLPFRALFQASTLADLAREVETSEPAAIAAAPPSQPLPRSQLLPLSAAQERFWFAHRNAPLSPTYNENLSIRAGAALDEATLRSALRRLVLRHEALRMTFVDVDGEPRKQVHADADHGFLAVDLRDLPEPEREAEAHRIVSDITRRPFDLSVGPLLCVTLVRLGDADDRIFLSFHHIVMDGIGATVFFSELEAAYLAVLAGEAPLAAPAVQEADMCAWQTAALPAARERDLPYWRERLDNLPELDLPTDRPRPPVQSFRGASFVRVLPRPLVARVRTAAASWGATPYQICLSAFVAMLQRLSQQDEVVLGTLTSGRTRPDAQSVLGCFVNTAALRIPLAGVRSFRDLVVRVREVAAEVYDHQAVPFHEVVAALQPARDAGKHPLFQVMFASEAPTPPSKSGWELHFMYEDKGTSRFDLVYELAECAGDLWLSVEYSTDLFDADTMSRMVDRYLLLLDGALEGHEQPAPGVAAALSTLPLVTPEERGLLARFSGMDTPYLDDACAHELFEAQVVRAPDAVALVFAGGSLTYRQLDARANQLAHHLRSLGVVPEARVGLCVQRSPALIIAILGIWKAGGAYVPLDPAYPRARLSFMVEDAKASVLVADRLSLAALPEHATYIVLLDDDAETLAALPVDRPDRVVRPDNLAYVMYTSGSTGRPKGVMVPHRGLCSLAPALIRAFDIGPTSRVLQFASPSFDLSTMEIIMTLPTGAALVLAPQGALMPGPALRQLLREQGVTVASLCPSAIAALDAGCDDTEAASLPMQTLIAGGEPCPAQLVTRWAPGRRFFNLYGPTETTIVATMTECVPDGERPSIGRPVPNTRCYVLDAHMQLVPPGVPGELFIGGVGVTRGYLDRPELTAERFVSNPFGEGHLYRTGDRVRWLRHGDLDFLGRMDRQVKLRGFRIELGEIEAELGRHPAVQVAAVEIVGAGGEDPRLVAYVVPREGASGGLELALKRHLRERLPEHMVPPCVITIAHMPIGPSGKIDRAALPAPATMERPITLATTDIEQAVAAVWREVLGVDVGVDAPFFEVGGHSLALVRVQVKLGARLGVNLDVVTLLRLPTIRQLAAHLAGLLGATRAARPALNAQTAVAPAPIPERPQDLAIIGMVIRAPGIHDARSLWDVVQAGRETIRVLDREALIAAGADPDRVHRPEFVAAEGVLEDADRFDAAFFGYSEGDALLMDPQQRIFLECAHAALEHAGYDPARFAGRIGVFAGAGVPRYWLGPVASHLRASGNEHDAFRAQTLNSPDFLATRVAFKLGLRGPAVTVQTACSTSLSAVHVARQSLLAGECDLALAGGVSIASLSEAELGHLHAEAGILSSDGHCRAFDAGAGGTVKSSGVAIVVLKRLADALADGDRIHAVVLGSAMSNDGAAKVGFTAPSEDGLAEAITRAYEVAGVDPGSVGFVETHGTGTRLGDPTEVRALTRAYRRWTEGRGFCALGSLKANLGHLDAAAGAAGLIKATLALEHGIIPPLSGFRAANPLLDLPSTPFFVNEAALPWPLAESPRRAGVSAMGIGGTNVHVVLEQAPRAPAPASGRPFQLLCLSARTPAALAELTRRVRDDLAVHPSLDLADVAHTLAVGRTPQRYRATFVCHDTTGAIEALTQAPASTSPPLRGDRPVVFLFPGHGVQYLKLGIDLYQAEPIFKGEVDRCLDILREEMGCDLRPLLTGAAQDGERQLDDMQWAQPFLFTIEYALARQLLAWGVRPTAMLGHSLGEYVAACIAGVFSLRDALFLVTTRGRLMDTTPPGSMLTVFADERAVQPYLQGGVAIATYAPGCVVLSGPAEAIEAARARLASAGVETSGVRVSRASHSPLMHGIRDEFRRCVADVELHPPAIDVVSNVTGAYLTAEQATSPDYWADHLCRPVRLGEGLGTLLALQAPVCLELGPGSTLGSFLKGHPQFAGVNCDVAATLPGFRMRDAPCHAALLRGLGRAWELGVVMDWRAFYGHERRRRVPLPTYPFEGRRYMLGSRAEGAEALDERAITLAHELGVRPISDHPGLRAGLEALCGSLVLDFFARRLGQEVERARSVEALRQRAGILPTFAPMIEALVEILVRTGLAKQTGEGAILLRADMVGRSTGLAAGLRQDHPTMAGLVRFLEHCVGHYDEALTGTTEPIGVLYPDGTDAFYQACMRDTAPYLHDQVCLTMAREAARKLIQARKGKKTRILEIGAGHGTLTWPLVEGLGDADIEYHFTDIGRSFLQRAEAEAARRGITSMSCLRFDLNRAPEEQGLGGPYDLVLGYNAVHVAHNLSTTLRRLHGMLAPGGSLVLVEMLRIEPWDHLTWGLAPGYWDVVVARGSLVMNLDHWEQPLARAGFERIVSVPRDARERERADHGLLLAERSAAAPTARLAESTARALPPKTAANGVTMRAPRTEVGEGPSAAVDPASASSAATVQRMWKRLLGVSHVPTDSSFFEMGGDSLLAVQFLAELRVRGGEIKMRQFAADPTVAGLAALLDAGEPPPPAALAEPPAKRRVDLASPELKPSPGGAEACLVTLAAGGTKRPFFCVHPIGGSVLCYVHLARAMGPERPFIGLQSPMQEELAARPDSIEALAALYVDAIRLVQPRGPYLLGGWSFGGVVATEMARQLQSHGDTVTELVLLDVSPVWRADLELLRSIEPRPPQDLAEHYRAVRDHNLSIWRHHVPAQLDVPVTHFVAENGPLFDKVSGCGAAVRAETLVPVPGDHFSMLAGANTVPLAASMSEALDAAERRARAPGEVVADRGAEQVQAVRAYLQQFMDLSRRDGRAVVEELWAQVDSCVLFDSYDGTFVGSTDVRDQYAREFDAIRCVDLSMYEERVQIFAGGEAACATALLNADLALVQSGKLVCFRRVRATWVLENSANGWRALHVHYSLPVGEPLSAMQ